MSDGDRSQSIIVRGKGKSPVDPALFRFSVRACSEVQNRLDPITISLDVTPEKDILRVRAWSSHWLPVRRVFVVPIGDYNIVGSDVLTNMMRAILDEIVKNPQDWDEIDRAALERVLRKNKRIKV